MSFINQPVYDLIVIIEGSKEETLEARWACAGWCGLFIVGEPKFMQLEHGQYAALHYRFESEETRQLMNGRLIKKLDPLGIAYDISFNNTTIRVPAKKPKQ